MRIDIVQKNYEMSDREREIITKKVQKLDKYFEDDTAVKLVLKKDNGICKMEITAKVGGLFVRSEGSGEKTYDVIDKVLPKLESQLNKHKSKLKAKLKSTAFKTPLLFEGATDKEPEGVVEKTKTFAVQPMSVEEAALEMDLVGHDFFLFADEKSKQLQVLYRRDNGNFGLLRPQIEE